MFPLDSLVFIFGSVNNKLIIITCGVIIVRDSLLCNDAFIDDDLWHSLDSVRFRQPSSGLQLLGLSLLLRLLCSPNVDITAGAVVGNVLGNDNDIKISRYFSNLGLDTGVSMIHSDTSEVEPPVNR